MKLRETFRELNNQRYVPFIFSFLAAVLILRGFPSPIHDFGNYYYGSKLLLQGKFTPQIYTDINYLNEQVRHLGARDFFLNYIPVPPFSALFYTPFCMLQAHTAKLVFNLLSLLVFSLVLFRLLKHYELHNSYMLLVPLILLIPLRNNIEQGQTYLLIIGFLSESVIRSEKKQKHVPAILCALSMALKIFPGFILVYFILKKNYQLVAWALLYFVSLNLFCLFFIDSEIISHYYSNVLPRLAANDIIGAYNSVNQSVYSFLLNLFSSDALQNPHPVLQMPYLVPVIESVFVALAIAFLVGLKNESSLLLFGVCLFVLLLCSRYNPSYSLLLLLPMLLFLLKNNQVPSKSIVLVIALLALAIATAVYPVTHSAILLKFGRILLFIAAFIITMWHYRIRPNLKLLLLVFIPLVSYRCYSFSMIPIRYFGIQNKQGILYDMKLRNDTLLMYSTLGETVAEEKKAAGGKIKADPGLLLIGNKLIYNGKLIMGGCDNKLKPFLYCDSLIVFMSDQNQALGFYKLRVISTNE